MKTTVEASKLAFKQSITVLGRHAEKNDRFPVLSRTAVITYASVDVKLVNLNSLDDFPQHLETQIISQPIEMTHFRQLPSLSQQFLEPPENISGSFALVKF